MLHTCAIRFDVTGILKTFWFLGELNKALFEPRKGSANVEYQLNLGTNLTILDRFSK